MSGSRCADAHHGQKSRWLQHRPDICLHPILITRSRFLLTRGRSPYRSAFVATSGTVLGAKGRSPGTPGRKVPTHRRSGIANEFANIGRVMARVNQT